jgi:ABC-type Fe3+ transport system permease subunit
LLSQEFTASLFVRTTATPVMGTVVYDFWAVSGYGVAAAMGLVMCAITVLGVGIFLLVGRGRPVTN